MTRFTKAAKAYLERKGYVEVEPFKHDGEDFLFAIDGEVSVVVLIKGGEPGAGRFEKENTTYREKLERAMIKILPEKEKMVDCPVRLDIMSFCVFEEDRALIRHHINITDSQL